MIIMIAEVVTHPGKELDYERCFRELQAVVAVKEPRTLVYQSAKCREEPSTYRAVEIFADQAALDFHDSSEWLRDGWAEMQKAIAHLKVTIHDPIVTEGNRLSTIDIENV